MDKPAYVLKSWRNQTFTVTTTSLCINLCSLLCLPCLNADFCILCQPALYLRLTNGTRHNQGGTGWGLIFRWFSLSAAHCSMQVICSYDSITDIITIIPVIQ